MGGWRPGQSFLIFFPNLRNSMSSLLLQSAAMNVVKHCTMGVGSAEGANPMGWESLRALGGWLPHLVLEKSSSL